jgi:universal stress protein A
MCLAPFSPREGREDDVIKRIVVPMDFSPPAEAALRSAIALAKVTAGTLCLVHVVENPVEGGAWSGRAYAVSVEAEHVARVEDAERQLKARLGELPAEFATGSWVRTGHVAAAIVNFAREMDADLIAMGTNGRRGLGHLILGSVAEHVLRHAPCPVLTVRADAVDESNTAARPAASGARA